MAMRMSIGVSVLILAAQFGLAANPPKEVASPKLVIATADGKGNIEFEYSKIVMKPVTVVEPGVKFPVTSLSMTTVPERKTLNLADVVVRDLDGNRLDNAQIAKRLKKPTVVVVISQASNIDVNLKSALKDGTLIVCAPTVALP